MHAPISMPRITVAPTTANTIPTIAPEWIPCEASVCVCVCMCECVCVCVCMCACVCVCVCVCVCCVCVCVCACLCVCVYHVHVVPTMFAISFINDTRLPVMCDCVSTYKASHNRYHELQCDAIIKL